MESKLEWRGAVMLLAAFIPSTLRRRHMMRLRRILVQGSADWRGTGLDWTPGLATGLARKMRVRWATGCRGAHEPVLCMT